MNIPKPTEQEIKQGFKECKICNGLLLLEACLEVKTSSCMQCGQHVASREEFFNVPVELMSK